MTDIMLTKDGDLAISETGDISVTESVRQAILVRLRWIYQEWRLGPEYGFPWFEEIWVKNPNEVKIRHLIREEIMTVEEVVAAKVLDFRFDKKNRAVTITYEAETTEETFREEVTLYE